MVIFSGECSSLFKFKLVGLERINTLFQELSDYTATNNSMTLPSNLKLYPTMEDQPTHSSSKGLISKKNEAETTYSRIKGWFSNKFGMSDENDDPRVKIPSMLRQSMRIHQKKKPIKSLSQHKDFLEF
jgi:hypothetical protein